MKNFILTAILLFAAQTLMSTSGCEKRNRSTRCTGEEMCTMMFAMVNVEVKNASGEPVSLDEHYTIRKSTSQKIDVQNQSPTEGSYTVLDDGYRKSIEGSTDEFIFVGKKNGQEVVRETYVISADCCHISKQSGKAEVVIP